MTAMKLSLITRRSRKDESKAKIKHVKTLLLMKWTVCENILASPETAVGIYNQQVIQRHWNNTQQSFCFCLSHIKSGKRSLISEPLTRHFFCFSLIASTILSVMTKIARISLWIWITKSTQNRRNLHLRWICRSRRTIITVTSECSGSCLYWNSSSKSANLVLKQ